MLKRLIEYCETKSGNIYLFGAGGYGRKVGVWLDENKFCWKAYIETKKSAEMVLERRVLCFEEIKDKQGVSFIVCVSERYREEIVSLLIETAIEDYIVITSDEIQQIDNCNKYNKNYAINKYVNVLLYHRVIDLPTDPQLLAIDVDRFEGHIKHLSENYKILRFEDDWSDVDEKSVVITFDDGYVDNYLYALPILEKYKVPATVFVSTGNIDSANEMWWDSLEALFLLNKNLPNQIELCGEILDLSTKESLKHSYILTHRLLKKVNYSERDRLINHLIKLLSPQDFPRSTYRCMTTSELVKLSKSEIITIGGHTVTHSSLACESSGEQYWEIFESKRILEEKIAKEISVFSYPFGSANDYTDETCEIAKSVGYKKAAIVKAGLSFDEDCMKIPRNLVRNWDVNEFRRRLNSTWTIYGA